MLHPLLAIQDVKAPNVHAHLGRFSEKRMQHLNLSGSLVNCKEDGSHCYVSYIE